MKILFISRTEIEELLLMHDVIRAVEEAFRAKGLGKVQMPSKSYVYLDRYGGDFRVMPAYLEESGATGVKIVNVHPRNPKEFNLPTVMATILLLDQRTGEPLAIMDGTHITNLRTGAGGAIAAKYLARRNSHTAGMVGAGIQARAQLMALSELFEIERVKVCSRTPESARRYAEEMSKRLGVDIRVVSEPEEAVKDVDIVVTSTPSRIPLVLDEWVAEGTHINAIGADAPGKEEIDPLLLKRAKIVVDDWRQAAHSGEINVPLAKGLITKDDIYGELGEIVAGKKCGRASEEEITVFDSTGLAIQDVATAWFVYQKAREEGKGSEMEL